MGSVTSNAKSSVAVVSAARASNRTELLVRARPGRLGGGCLRNAGSWIKSPARPPHPQTFNGWCEKASALRYRCANEVGAFADHASRRRRHLDRGYCCRSSLQCRSSRTAGARSSSAERQQSAGSQTGATRETPGAGSDGASCIELSLRVTLPRKASISLQLECAAQLGLPAFELL
jgi:hypothetical protein